jgi:hypothetical protein
VASENDVFGLRDPFFQERRRDGALVDMEEGDIVVGSLMKKDDELDEVGVGLLPERLLARPKRLFRSEAMLYARAYASRSLWRGL